MNISLRAYLVLCHAPICSILSCYSRTQLHVSTMTLDVGSFWACSAIQSLCEPSGRKWYVQCGSVDWFWNAVYPQLFLDWLIILTTSSEYETVCVHVDIERYWACRWRPFRNIVMVVRCRLCLYDSCSIRSAGVVNHINRSCRVYGLQLFSLG